MGQCPAPPACGDAANTCGDAPVCNIGACSVPTPARNANQRSMTDQHDDATVEIEHESESADELDRAENLSKSSKYDLTRENVNVHNGSPAPAEKKRSKNKGIMGKVKSLFSNPFIGEKKSDSKEVVQEQGKTQLASESKTRGFTERDHLRLEDAHKSQSMHI